MKTQKALEDHELAKIFPEMGKPEYDALKAAILAHGGLIEPVWTYQGKILDGRHRYRACRELGIEPEVQPWEGPGDPLDFVLWKNLHRRHLSSSQLAILAVEIERRLAKLAKQRQRAGEGSKKAVVEDIPQPQENGPKGRARDHAAYLSWRPWRPGGSERPQGTGTRPCRPSAAHQPPLCKRRQEAVRDQPQPRQEVKEGKMTLPEAMRRLKSGQKITDATQQQPAQRGQPLVDADSSEVPGEQGATITARRIPIQVPRHGYTAFPGAGGLQPPRPERKVLVIRGIRLTRPTVAEAGNAQRDHTDATE